MRSGNPDFEWLGQIGHLIAGPEPAEDTGWPYQPRSHVMPSALRLAMVSRRPPELPKRKRTCDPWLVSITKHLRLGFDTLAMWSKVIVQT